MDTQCTASVHWFVTAKQPFRSHQHNDSISRFVSHWSAGPRQSKRRSAIISASLQRNIDDHQQTTDKGMSPAKSLIESAPPRNYEWADEGMEYDFEGFQKQAL